MDRESYDHGLAELCAQVTKSKFPEWENYGLTDGELLTGESASQVPAARAILAYRQQLGGCNLTTLMRLADAHDHARSVGQLAASISHLPLSSRPIDFVQYAGMFLWSPEFCALLVCRLDPQLHSWSLVEDLAKDGDLLALQCVWLRDRLASEAKTLKPSKATELLRRLGVPVPTTLEEALGPHQRPELGTKERETLLTIIEYQVRLFLEKKRITRDEYRPMLIEVMRGVRAPGTIRGKLGEAEEFVGEESSTDVH